MLGDLRSASNVQGLLGAVAVKAGDAEAGLKLVSAACAYFRGQGDPFGLFSTLSTRARILHDLGRDLESRSDYLESVESAKSCGTTKTMEYYQTLSGLAEAEEGLGHSEEATRVARQALADAKPLADQYRWRGADFERALVVLKRIAGDLSK